jgi:phosphoribosylaminoimidazolecarboxamide formyltransferase/IMP cyclohydrolase
MTVVKHTKSNAIVVAKDLQTLGVGCGQTSRIWALESIKNNHPDVGLHRISYVLRRLLPIR